MSLHWPSCLMKTWGYIRTSFMQYIKQFISTGACYRDEVGPKYMFCILYHISKCVRMWLIYPRRHRFLSRMKNVHSESRARKIWNLILRVRCVTLPWQQQDCSGHVCVCVCIRAYICVSVLKRGSMSPQNKTNK